MLRGGRFRLFADDYGIDAYEGFADGFDDADRRGVIHGGGGPSVWLVVVAFSCYANTRKRAKDCLKKAP
ncbi:hypothetical protein Q1695_013368 [Nippostrongylus brasiliensis]|nr:hypothetical protein Q1695_013368 [Nippostrongylus brasiliensis]